MPINRPGAVLIALLVLSPTLVQAGGNDGASPRSVPSVVFRTYRLKNGLRVVLSPDAPGPGNPPVVAIAISFGVGSRDERPGQQGFAHLFEHLRFEGSQHVRPGDFQRLVAGCGGTVNAFTTADDTYYYEKVPSTQVELGLFLEADRLASLDLSSATFERARRVVEAENRQRKASNALDNLDEQLTQLSYDRFGYRHQTIGTMEDLRRATIQDAQVFYATYYGPENATIAVAGNFNEVRVRTLIDRDFGGIARHHPAGYHLPPADVENPETVLPSTGSGRNVRQTASVPNFYRRLPHYETVFRIPPRSYADFPALDLLSDILAGGSNTNETPLRTALVHNGTALEVGSSVNGRNGVGLFSISADLPATAHSYEAVEARIDAELARISQKGVGEEELRRAKQYERTDYLRRYTILNRACWLANESARGNGPEFSNTYQERLRQVTTGDIQRVAQRYLIESNRVVVTTILPMSTPPTSDTLWSRFLGLWRRK